MRSPDIFLPLPRLRLQLFGSREEVSAEDNDLAQEAREFAISYLSDELGWPVIDRYEAVFCPAVTSTTKSITIRRPHAQSLAVVRYWTPGANMDAGPDGSLLPLPRVSQLPDDGGLRVHKPSAGWPEHQSDGGVWLVVSAGLDAEHILVGKLRQAAIAAARSYASDGVREIRDMDAAPQLLWATGDMFNGADREQDWDKWIPDPGTGSELTFGGEPVTVGYRDIRG